MLLIVHDGDDGKHTIRGSKPVHGATMLHLQEAWKTARPEMGSVAVFACLPTHTRARNSRVCARPFCRLFDQPRGLLGFKQGKEKNTLADTTPYFFNFFFLTHSFLVAVFLRFSGTLCCSLCYFRFSFRLPLSPFFLRVLF